MSHEQIVCCGAFWALVPWRTPPQILIHESKDIFSVIQKEIKLVLLAWKENIFESFPINRGYCACGSNCNLNIWNVEIVSQSGCCRVVCCQVLLGLGVSSTEASDVAFTVGICPGVTSAQSEGGCTIGSTWGTLMTLWPLTLTCKTCTCNTRGVADGAVSPGPPHADVVELVRQVVLVQY